MRISDPYTEDKTPHKWIAALTNKSLEGVLLLLLAGVLFLSGVSLGLLVNVDKAPNSEEPIDTKLYYQGDWILCEKGEIWIDNFLKEDPYSPPAGTHAWIYGGRTSYHSAAILCNGTGMKKL